MPSKQLSFCDSERPNSWATHRTLTIPESCIQGSAMEIAMADALCCVYTHVVVVDGNRPYLETYDGSMYAYGECSSSVDAYTPINVMQDVLGSVCGMSMGSRDCFDQSTCIEDALSTPPPSPEISTRPSSIVSNIPTAEPISFDFVDDDDDDNATTFSPFPSLSPSPSQALSFPPSSLNATNATTSSVMSLEFVSSSGSLSIVSPAIAFVVVSFCYCVSALC